MAGDKIGGRELLMKKNIFSNKQEVWELGNMDDQCDDRRTETLLFRNEMRTAGMFIFCQ